MMKKMEISKLDTALSKYKLDDILFLIGRKSQDMYIKKTFLDEIKFRKHLIKSYYIIKRLYIPIWVLSDISFRAIIHSDDFRPCIPDYRVIVNLINTKAIEENEKAQYILNEDKERIVAHILYGIPNTQFPFQDILKGKVLYYRVIRYYVILNIIPAELPKLKHPSDDLLEMTGFNYEDFFKILMIGFCWVATESPEISFNLDETVTSKDPLFNSDNLRKCLSYFIGDYEFYRKFDTYNPLFYRPIVKTETGRYIISNAFLWAMKLYEGIYWIIRKKYENDCKGNEFTGNFGQYFESYCEHLLKFYLSPDGFQKITEPGKADWLIYSEKYIIILEQKSSLMSIKYKKEYPAMEELKSSEFVTSLEKACKQLIDTEKDIKDTRRMVKIILHFEKLYMKEAFYKDVLFERLGRKIERLFLLDIEEFEQLMQILSEDENLFEKIIDRMLENEMSPPPVVEGRDVRDIMRNLNYWQEIKFLEQYGHILDFMHDKKEC